MKRNFELSRRDPMAHNALINQRREEEARKLQHRLASFPQQSGFPAQLPHSTQPSRWDTPLIATGDMLLPPSTAPGGPLLYTPFVANLSSAISPQPDQPQLASTPAAGSEAGKSASVPDPNQSRSSVVAPWRLSESPRLTSHDLQKHIIESYNSAQQAGTSTRGIPSTSDRQIIRRQFIR